MRTEADEVMRVIAKTLHDDGYLRDDGRMLVVADVLGPFSKMRADAAKQRARPTEATGRETALSFLKATVEDVNKPMGERMEAARMLLMHTGEDA